MAIEHASAAFRRGAKKGTVHHGKGNKWAAKRSNPNVYRQALEGLTGHARKMLKKRLKESMEGQCPD